MGPNTGCDTEPGTTQPKRNFEEHASFLENVDRAAIAQLDAIRKYV